MGFVLYHMARALSSHNHSQDVTLLSWHPECSVVPHLWLFLFLMPRRPHSTVPFPPAQPSIPVPGEMRDLIHTDGSIRLNTAVN